MAGDLAANQIERNLTTENVQAASQYATKENAQTAWEGAKWADKKADEYGIDKEEVAIKAGTATWNAAKKVNWSAVGSTLASGAQTGYNAAQGAQNNGNQY